MQPQCKLATSGLQSQILPWKKCFSKNYVVRTAPLDQPTFSVPLRTGTCYIRDIFVLFSQDYCALQELLMKMNFTLAVAPPFVYQMTSLPATPTHSVCKYGFFSELAQQRQLAKYSNLKYCESLPFSGDIESLEPSKFNPSDC